MTITVQPVTEDFVAEVGDVDLARPLSAEDEAAVKRAFWTYAVLVFPEQKLTEEQHLDFARLFGPLETSIGAYRTDETQKLRPELTDVSNVQAGGDIWADDNRVRHYKYGDRLWHTDSSFKFVPARASLLYAKVVPPIGGHTEFCDTRAAYDALSDETKAGLEGLVAEHSIFHSRARYGFDDYVAAEHENLKFVPQALVRSHAESGRRMLYIAAHAGRILGMDEAEGRALVDRLLAHCDQRRFHYTHRWRLGDLVIWDDRCTMHRGTAYDDLRWPRELVRATVSDEVNSCAREGLTVAA